MRDVLTILLFQCLVRREALAQTCNIVRDGDKVGETPLMLREDVKNIQRAGMYIAKLSFNFNHILVES